MGFDIDCGDLPESYTSASDAATVEFDAEDLRWRVPWRTQARWFVELVWTKGWASVWQDGLWWRSSTVEAIGG